MVFTHGAVAHAGGGWKKRKGKATGLIGNQIGEAYTGKGNAAAQPRRAKPDDEVASPNVVRADSGEDLVFGSPIHFQNLSIVPVSTTRQGPFKTYTVLEEGLRAQTLAVRELKGNSGEAQVEAVEIRNRGEHPVYLLGGEMILGGKQDRIIQQDTVVASTGKWTRVSVFCVEQGRWAGQKMKFSAGKAVAHLRLQKAAMSGSQSEVWSEVARKNLKHGTQNSTSTYRRTIQNGKVRAKIAPYRKKLLRMLPPGIPLAGLVFAINGKIQVADLFGNPPLFKKLTPKLLSAYILEALGQEVIEGAPPVSTKGATRFFLKAKAAKKVRVKGKASGRAINYKRKGKGIIGTQSVDKASGETLRESLHAN